MMEIVEMLRWLAYNILPTIATIAISVTYVPQIIKTHRTKSVNDMSVMFWILLNVFLLCMWTNSLFAFIDSNNVGYFVTQSINWLLAIIQTTQLFMYKKKK